MNSKCFVSTYVFSLQRVRGCTDSARAVLFLAEQLVVPSLLSCLVFSNARSRCLPVEFPCGLNGDEQRLQ